MRQGPSAERIVTPAERSGLILRILADPVRVLSDPASEPEAVDQAARAPLGANRTALPG
jgi:hypothetical protein